MSRGFGRHLRLARSLPSEDRPRISCNASNQWRPSAIRKCTARRRVFFAPADGCTMSTQCLTSVSTSCANVVGVEQICAGTVQVRISMRGLKSFSTNMYCLCSSVHNCSCGSRGSGVRFPGLWVAWTGQSVLLMLARRAFSVFYRTCVVQTEFWA